MHLPYCLVRVMDDVAPFLRAAKLVRRSQISPNKTARTLFEYIDYNMSGEVLLS